MDHNQLDYRCRQEWKHPPLILLRYGVEVFLINWECRGQQSSWLHRHWQHVGKPKWWHEWSEQPSSWVVAYYLLHLQSCDPCIQWYCHVCFRISVGTHNHLWSLHEDKKTCNKPACWATMRAAELSLYCLLTIAVSLHSCLHCTLGQGS